MMLIYDILYDVMFYIVYLAYDSNPILKMFIQLVIYFFNFFMHVKEHLLIFIKIHKFLIKPNHLTYDINI